MDLGVAGGLSLIGDILGVFFVGGGGVVLHLWVVLVVR